MTSVFLKSCCNLDGVTTSGPVIEGFLNEENMFILSAPQATASKMITMLSQHLSKTTSTKHKYYSPPESRIYWGMFYMTELFFHSTWSCVCVLCFSGC